MAATASGRAKPLLVRQSEAAVMLGITPRTLQKRISEGMFTVRRPHGYGQGRPCFLMVDEVELYAEKGADAVANLRAAKRRK